VPESVSSSRTRSPWWRLVTFGISIYYHGGERSPAITAGRVQVAARPAGGREGRAVGPFDFAQGELRG
jgi:hypothetical protein